MPRPVIIDCDPGVDDAITLAMAVASPELEVLGVTTTYGNVGVGHTTNNALRVLDWLGSPIRVYRGSGRPLLAQRVDAVRYHGATGLEAPALPQPQRGPEALGAVQFLIHTLSERPDKITVVAIGPLTNLALALRLEPKIIPKIEQIVLMGGSTDYGNDSPAAEFNMLSDPHAAQIVLSSGVPAVVFGLNVTHQIIASPEETAKIRAIGNETCAIVADLMDFFKPVYLERYGFAGPALHDPCTIAYLLQPEIFRLKAMSVDVETNSGLSFGRMVHDIWGLTGRPRTTLVATEADSARFFELLRARLAALR